MRVSMIRARVPLVARGDYLVHDVAMCTDCHGATLHGAKVPGSGEVACASA